MKKDTALQNTRKGWMGWWPAGGIVSLLDPENARIKQFLLEQRKLMPENSRVLDAGAGSRPYEPIFSGLVYESTDMPGGFYDTRHDFECFLDSIPQADNTYDIVLLTQVLEHVPSPTAVLKEVQRILKPGGKLLLSVPLNGPLHGEPWHFFHFTHHGIVQLAKNSNLQVIELEKVGGAFWLLGKRLPDTFRKLIKQHDPFRAKKRQQNVWLCTLWSLLLLPVWLFVYLPCAYILRPAFYWLDLLDQEKSFTLGYTAILQK